MEKKKILLHGGGWITNIGNAFIDYGIQSILNKVFDKVDISLTSSSHEWFTYQVKSGIKGKLIGKNVDNSNIFNLSDLDEFDYVVQCGACMGKDWFDIYGNFLKKASESDTKLLLIGVGMTDTAYEEGLEESINCFKELDPHVFVSRDEKTYKYFKDISPNHYNGIDCVFFLEKNYSLNSPEEEYVVFNFDKVEEPELDVDEKVIRSHHSFWFNFDFKNFLKMKKQYYHKENVLISEIPEDYLRIYNGTNRTYSDRVHACIPTLVFGNKARLFSKTKRSLLFDRVGLGDITKQFVDLNKDFIESEKEDEIMFLKNTLE